MSESGKDMQDNLENIYNDIRQWLLFAEAKNLMLLTLALFVLGEMGNKDSFAAALFSQRGLWCLTGFSLLGAGIACLSFVPWLNSWRWLLKGIDIFNNETAGNLIYYRDIYTLARRRDSIYGNAYIKVLCGRYRCERSAISGYQEDLINQIVSCSEITVLKYIFFRCGCFVFALEALFIAVALIAGR